MTQFQFKIIDEHTPLTEDPFYAWLDANVYRGDPGQGLIRKYLTSMGFELGKDTITGEQHKILEYVEETWFRLTPYHLPMTLDECFTPGADYYVAGLEGGRRNITLALKQAVDESGFIYGVDPKNCFFEIIDDRLYAKYQQILGSRFICRIREA